MRSDPTLPALRCPKCGGDFIVYERQGIVIDQCRECRGVWLDRGELEHLISLEASLSMRNGPLVTPARDAGAYRDDPGRERRDDADRGRWDDDGYDSDGDRRGGRRRGGLFGELFEGFLD